MKRPKEFEPHPESNDLDGWRLAVKEKRHVRFRLEAIVGAIQDLGVDSDIEMINTLADFLSEKILGILRGMTCWSYPNEGEDIIHDAHHKLMIAILSPKTADGKAMREAFIPRLRFRHADAIRNHKRGDEVKDDAETGRGVEECKSREPSISEQAYVEQVLSRILDDRKRLAFRLYMENVPVKSKRTMSISETLGVSDTTIDTWIEEIQIQLRAIVEEKS